MLRSTTYHEPISAVNIRNASAGGRATTTVALTAPAAASTQLTRAFLALGVASERRELRGVARLHLVEPGGQRHRRSGRRR